jgi:D-xylose reductase
VNTKLPITGDTVIEQEMIQLASGQQVPSVGLGLWKIEQDATAQVVQQAIDCGYRHFDSACDYGNEVQTGEGLAASLSKGIVKREDLWVTSKLWNTYHRKEHVRPALEKSLHDLQLDYLDLYLVHFPIAQNYVPIEERYPPGWFADPEAAYPVVEADRVPIIETWRAMEDLVQTGLVKEIGVCNFGCSLLRDLMNQAEIPPAMLQIEMHPYLTQEKLTRFCHESNIGVTAFSPLGAQSYFQLNMAEDDESLLKHDLIKGIAAQHQRSPAQILLRWGVQRGTSVVPKTANIERLRENMAVYDFALSDEDMSAIAGLNRDRRFNDPGDFCESAFNTFLPIYE